MDITPLQRGSRFVVLIWVLAGFVYFNIASAYVRASMSARQLDEYTSYVVQLVGDEHRPTKEARDLILVKADELGLPLHGEQIRILGEGTSLKVSVAYGVDIHMPLIDRVIYRKNFRSTVHYAPSGQTASQIQSF